MRTRAIVGVLAASLVAVFATAPQSAAAATPAPRTAADCERGANGFRDIPDTLRGTQAVAPVTLPGGPVVRLYYGTVAGAQRGWAMIDGGTFARDRVWLNWSLDGGANIHVQCGPFLVDATGSTKTSAAKTTSGNANYRFQACGQSFPYATPFQCTAWW
ncbi:hypothetical protein GCM10022225_53850 [Plantactinospora mayteni]|uniref:Secreted protein n=1 Tax=Plantactinospora mayteni TaxID=566021 RepID=A0ABQ4EJR9_9ACTN|nr:hypothetical protein [Plantactinospora mayteni]GIG95003.1 hypothetical protein Pma05_15760 [Plantactinospora mayteni]